MRRLLCSAALVAVAFILSLPTVSRAAEPRDYATVAREAEDTPPLIPHQVIEGTNGETCLVCHKGGASGAPITPHAMRLYCTQCHVPKLGFGPKQAARKTGAMK